MSTTSTAQAQSAPIVRISGKISNVDPYPRAKPTRWTYLLRMPAPDSFTTPQTVEVVSAKPIGNVDEVVTVDCEVGGRFRSYGVTDKTDGEIRTVRTADNTLHVVVF